MIEKMKLVHIITEVSHKKELLDGLYKLGVLHLREKKHADNSCSERITMLSAAISALQEYADKTPGTELDEESFAALLSEITAVLAVKKDAAAARSAAHSAIGALQKWGEFAPDDMKLLREQGIDLHIYRVDKKTLAVLSKDPDIRYLRISPVEKRETIAVWGTLPASYVAEEFVIPEKGIAALRCEIEACDRKLQEADLQLQKAACYLPTFRTQLLKAQSALDYSAVNNTAETSDGLIWLCGYIPADDMDSFKTAALQNHWAWAMDDPPQDDERVPTKVKYTKVTRLMIPIFDILGIVPGYREYDISFWFLCFFTLFFAMILGDAGYGCLMLLGAVGLTIKTRKLKNITILLWVLSIATVVWGALTGTWFGMEAAMEVPFLRSLVIPTFANYPAYFGVAVTAQQNAIMKFCFIIGTLQLSLACIMCIRTKLKIKDLSWVADLGWLCAICALYFLVLFLVIGEEVSLLPIAVTVGIGFMLVVLFGAMSPDKSFVQGIKSGLANAFTVFLNTISAFGNVMSYIRLFAVGMASLAIAQSFNSMATGFRGPLVIVGVVIVLIGHALNFAMGMLSVFVHGVRLNLLEFSGQLGMEWTGIAYQPFKSFDENQNKEGE